MARHVGLQIHPPSVNCASSRSAREDAASKPVHVWLEIVRKRLPLLRQLSEERFELRRTYILGRRPEAMLPVAADLNQVLQDSSFRALGHDTLPRTPMPKFPPIGFCLRGAWTAPARSRELREISRRSCGESSDQR
jgi:hypothetical protein